MDRNDKIAEIRRLQKIAEIRQLQAAPESEKIVQEMHPDISVADRAIVKNFGNDDDSSIGFLQKNYPGLEIKKSKAGQIIARKQGEQEFRALDPENTLLESLNPLNWAETGRDLLDVGSDVVTGIGTSAATAAGGIAGAAAGGVGAIPAAMAAGAGSSAALEGLRQLAGGALGVNDSANWGDVGIAGAAGALSPLLLGSGASGKAIAKAGIEKASQRGLVGMGIDKYVKPGLAKVGGVLSGTGSDALNNLGKHFKQFEKTTEDKTGVIKFIDETGKHLDDRFKTAKDKAWQEFTEAIGDYGDEATVDLAPVKERFQMAIASAKERAASGTEASRALLDRLEGAYDELFRFNKKEQIPNVVNKGIGILDDAGNEIVRPVTEFTEQVVRKDINTLSPRQAVELEKQLSELAGFNKIDSRQVTGNRFAGGMMADDKHLQTIAADLKRTLGESVEQVLPENAIPAKRRYGELLGLEKNIEALTGNPRQAFTNLRNADVSSNITNIQQFRQIDDAIGSNLEQRAKFAEGLDLFGPGRKSWFHGGMSRVPAAALGGATGAYMGRQGGTGSGYETGLAGAGLGFLLGSPAAMRNYIKYGIKAGNVNQSLAPLRVGAGKEIIERQMVSPWQMMQQRSAEK